MGVVLLVFIIYIEPIIKGKILILFNTSESGKGFGLING